MNRLSSSLITVTTICLAAFGTEYGSAQISATGASGFSRIGIGTPLSNQMTGDGDLYLRNDIELGGELYLDGEIFMLRDAVGPFGEDQRIYFADNTSRTNEYLGWDDSADMFVLTNDLGINGAIETFNGNTLRLRSFTEQMSFLLDLNADIDAAIFPHTFTWFNNFETNGSRAMQLTSTDASVGDLTLAGSLTQNGFDLAEMFLLAEPAEAGQLVSVSDLRPDVVRPAVAGDAGRILGIVATDPGIVLGGGALSLEALHQRWGEAVTEEFQDERSTLESEIYTARDGLRDEALLLRSFATFSAYFERTAAWPAIPPDPEHGREHGDDGPPPPATGATFSEEEMRNAYRQALSRHEMVVFDLVMEQFFRRRFVRVALAGRVPVRVDADFAAIEIGDPLTAGPEPGVAVKARHEGTIVGTALEAMPSGTGTLLAFVDRGWFGGESRTRLADLEAQLLELRAALIAKVPPPPVPLLARLEGIAADTD